MIDKNLKIAVICGGMSSEREVSLRSGKAIYDALMRRGFQRAFLFDLTEETVSELATVPMDLAFLALHGKGGRTVVYRGFWSSEGFVTPDPR